MTTTHLGRAAAILSALGWFACGVDSPAQAPTSAAPDPATPASPPGERASDEPAPEAPSCEALAAAAEDTLASVVASHAACTFDTECSEASLVTRCGAPCSAAVHPAGLAALAEARGREDAARCARFEERGCERARRGCARSTPRCVEGACAMVSGSPPPREVPIPPENALGQEPPPPRPPPGEPERERAARLLRAIATDDPTLAQDFFFPREAFSRVKAIPDPDAYWQRLFRRYAEDIHALHAELADLTGAELVRLDVIRRGGWVPRGEEGNALPYWVSRHSRLYYRLGDEERSFEVRVLITWGERWYVTHLSEFH